MLFYIFRLKILTSGKMVTAEKGEEFIDAPKLIVDLKEAREVVRNSELNQRVFAALLGFYEVSDELYRANDHGKKYCYEISLEEIGELVEEDPRQLKETIKSFCKIGLLSKGINSYFHPRQPEYIEKTSRNYILFEDYLKKLCKD